MDEIKTIIHSHSHMITLTKYDHIFSKILAKNHSIPSHPIELTIFIHGIKCLIDQGKNIHLKNCISVDHYKTQCKKGKTAPTHYHDSSKNHEKMCKSSPHNAHDNVC